MTLSCAQLFGINKFVIRDISLGNSAQTSFIGLSSDSSQTSSYDPLGNSLGVSLGVSLGISGGKLTMAKSLGSNMMKLSAQNSGHSVEIKYLFIDTDADIKEDITDYVVTNNGVPNVIYLSNIADYISNSGNTLNDYIGYIEIDDFKTNYNIGASIEYNKLNGEYSYSRVVPIGLSSGSYDNIEVNYLALSDSEDDNYKDGYFSFANDINASIFTENISDYCLQFVYEFDYDQASPTGFYNHYLPFILLLLGVLGVVILSFARYKRYTTWLILINERGDYYMRKNKKKYSWFDRQDE